MKKKFPKKWEREIEEFNRKVENGEIDLIEFANAEEYLEWSRKLENNGGKSST